MAAHPHVATPVLPAPRGHGGPYRVCLVCLGNICRSPMAEVLLRDEVERAGLEGRVTVESAGTGDWHIGGPMDPRARAELSRRGYDGSRHVARQITPDWLNRYDLFIVMDQRNLATLRAWSGHDPSLEPRIALMRSFDPRAEPDAAVPDPYHGDAADYVATFDLVQAAARGLTRALADQLTPGAPSPARPDQR